MKKLVSILLACAMLLTLFVPAMAVEEQYPTIYIEGQGNSLYRPDGTHIYGLDVNVLALVKENLPDLLKTYFACALTGDFTEYNDKIYNLIAPLYKDVKLGNDGEPTDGSGIPADRDWKNGTSKIATTIDLTNGAYNVYRWRYDWRLSPLTLAKDLSGLIDQVLEKRA